MNHVKLMSTVIVLGLLAVSLMGQMSPEEAMKQLQAVEQPTPEQVAAMREQIADLKRENAALRARIKAADKTTEQLQRRVQELEKQVAAIPAKPEPLDLDLLPNRDNWLSVMKGVPNDPEKLAEWVEKKKGTVVAFPATVDNDGPHDVYDGFVVIRWLDPSISSNGQNIAYRGKSLVAADVAEKLAPVDRSKVRIFGRIADVQINRIGDSDWHVVTLDNSNIAPR